MVEYGGGAKGEQLQKPASVNELPHPITQSPSPSVLLLPFTSSRQYSCVPSSAFHLANLTGRSHSACPAASPALIARYDYPVNLV